MINAGVGVDTRDQLRFEILRRDLRLYRLAAHVELHPSRLGRMLRGREPLPPDVADRLRAAIDEEIRST